MSEMNFQTPAQEEARYDPQMLQKVTSLAARLQDQQQDTLTARQMEAIGSEVGLEPAFIRQALERLTARQEQTTKTTQKTETTEAVASKAEFWTVVAVLAFPFLWGTLAYFLRAAALPPPPLPPGMTLPVPVPLEYEVNRGLLTFFTLVAPAPLSALMGFLTGKRSVGFLSSLMLMASLAPGASYLLQGSLNNGINVYIPFMLAYFVITTPFAGALGVTGAWLRTRLFPARKADQTNTGPALSRTDLLSAIFTLQRQLESHRQHRAFLSVDVVGSTEMKRNGSALEIEHSFGQFRQWVEGIVQRCGGAMQSAAGDGMMCLFPTETEAVRAARLLQDSLVQFNGALNRLSSPFRIRCGVSAGDVAIEEGVPLGHLNSPVIDRAAVLQKTAAPGDIVVDAASATAALIELGRLTPLAQPVLGAPAFSWRSTPRSDDK